MEQIAKTYKFFKPSVIKIYTVIALIISFAIYEIFYCNVEFVVNKVLNIENIQYNFSLCRIVFYIAIIVIYLIFSKKLIEPIMEVAESKTKRILFYVYFPIMIIIIAYFYNRVLHNISIHSLLRVTLGTLNLIAGSIFLIYVSKDRIKNVIVGAFAFGLIFSISTEYYHAFDEKKHFLSAFNLANFNLFYSEDPINNSQFESIPHRMDGNEFYKYYDIKYDNIVALNTNLADTNSTPTTYSQFLYSFSALGILMARTIGGSVADVFVAGRIFNLLFYLLIMCTAIKIAPYKKNIFTAIAFLPMVIVLAASYSIDSTCVALVSLFIAYVLKMHTMEEIKLKHWGILVLLFLVMLTAKSMAYLAVGAIIFILPLWKLLKKQNKKVKIFIGILAIITCAILIGVLFYIKNNMIGTDVRGGEDVSAQGQMEYIINNPLKVVELELGYMTRSILHFDWLDSMHQNAFFTREFGPPTFLVIVLFYFYISILDDSYSFNKKEKAVFIATFLMVFFMTNIILYISFTPVGATTIEGYQARYLIPVLPLILLCLSNSKIKHIKGNYTNMFIMLFLGIILMTGVLEEIIMGRPIN